MKIRYALMAAGVVSALAAAPAFSQADNTNSRWSPSPFDTNLQRDSSAYYNGEVIYYSRGAPTYYYYNSGPVYPSDRPIIVAGIDRDLVVAADPTHVGPGNSLTNPTGNELSGQNSGGR